jgi:hypothetical protein
MLKRRKKKTGRGRCVSQAMSLAKRKEKVWLGGSLSADRTGASEGLRVLRCS